METLDINPYQTGSIEYGCEPVQYICVNLGDYMVDDKGRLHGTHAHAAGCEITQPFLT